MGRVVTSVVSTRKHDTLVGSKLLLIELMPQFSGSHLVAVDQIGAGTGELVLVATGSAARRENSLESCPIDALVVGIVDNEPMF